MDAPPLRLLSLALALSLGAAIALGVSRFSYALLLPLMKADLGWSYALAGALNTANALGYLIGAVFSPVLTKRFDPGQLLLTCAVLASVFIAATGFFVDADALLVQRFLAGLASSLVFIAGGLLAAHLGGLRPSRAGLLLGIYYGGVGAGIVLSTLLVPIVINATDGRVHNWRWAWWLLAIFCGAASAGIAWPAKALRSSYRSELPILRKTRGTSVWWRFRWALSAYAMFGFGYIGYMTFVIALLREQGASTPRITLFYGLLGLAVMASSGIWAKLLDRSKGGEALAILNMITGAAAVLPAISSSWPIELLSAIGFGAAFMSVPAATTAVVRHNLSAAQLSTGISAFTVVFAAGQVAGPMLVGWVSDGHGGLARGLVFSAATLWLGALLAWRQRPLKRTLSSLADPCISE